jgi:hypothetical protein
VSRGLVQSRRAPPNDLYDRYLAHVETQEITDTVVGVSTLALAVTTWMLARRTKQTVDEAAETRRLTLAMATEATRARLDASAPSVDVELGSVVWPTQVTGLCTSDAISAHCSSKACPFPRRPDRSEYHLVRG